MSRLPIRVRIMVGFALAMLLVLAAAATFVYLQQRADLTETIDAGPGEAIRRRVRGVR